MTNYKAYYILHVLQKLMHALVVQKQNKTYNTLQKLGIKC